MSSEPQRNESTTTAPPSEEHLDEEHLEKMTEQTDEVMASARRDVDRAKATLHDQILPASQQGVEPAPQIDDEDRDEDGNEDRGEDRGRVEAGEPDVDKDDTRGGWPNWR